MELLWTLWGINVILCLIIASAKNKNLWNAFGASAFLGIFALIYYIFATSEPQKKEEEEEVLECTLCNTEVSEEDSFCPKCGAKFEDDSIICPKCKTHNKEDAEFCKKCGIHLKAYVCDDCKKSFRGKSKFDEHYNSCKIRKRNEEKELKKDDIDISIILWILGIVLLAFLTWSIVQWAAPECPASCDDDNKCTKDFCSKETSYDCMNTPLLNCDGNHICEQGEYGSADCPNCDDGNACTADTYDRFAKRCVNEVMMGCVQ